MENTRKTDMEFVTKVTSDTCVKYLLAEVKFSRIYAKKITLFVNFAKFRLEF